MEAIVQQDFNGIDSLTLKTLPQPQSNPMTNLIQVKYNPVLPYDILGEQGTLVKWPYRALLAMVLPAPCSSRGLEHPQSWPTGHRCNTPG
ncbi:hypothetical protein JCM14202_1121 [Agrilactobacillus composti DSM 18527 = JCM 14202]|uniref:hypothetical protein n=1 Tax=Agrilactobacillus composti TaxID=398555 RepID=UPI00042DDEE7|nr:hypothetical protein [Agrilactobacillus composti]GAF39269.1 hypothetical protein JCM14202_1121 [Agrilactobacillus composti DSM 18527 = JCM 14202]